MAIIEKYANQNNRMVAETPYATFYVIRTPSIYLNSACITAWRKAGLGDKVLFDFEEGVIRLIPVDETESRNAYSVSPNGFGKGCRVAIPRVIMDQMPENKSRYPVTISEDGSAIIRWDV